jgi:hypothetical protein
MDDNILIFMGGIIISIIAYFLKQTMNDLKETKALSVNTKNELDVLRNDHTNKYDHITENFNRLEKAIIALTTEIKDLTKSIGFEKKNDNYKG